MRHFLNPYPDYDGTQQADTNNEIRKIIDWYIQSIRKNENSSRDGALYVGTSGIAYAYLKLHQSRKIEEAKTQESLLCAKLSIDKAKTLIRKSKPEDSASLLCGNAGIYAVSLVINHCAGNLQECQKDLEKFLEGNAVCQKINFNKYGSDEILFGRAGYLSGIYWLNQHLPSSQRISGAIITKICDVIIESGIQYSKRHKLNVPLMWECYGDQYLGAAHGVSAILQMLLESPLFAGNLEKMNEKQNLVKASVDGLLQMQGHDGNFPCTMENARETDHKLVHWCHGAPGVVYLMAKAYLIFKEQKYLKSCLKCGELVWNKGLLRKGPGICHGVSGNGYVFLLLYRLTNDLKHLYRASCFAKFLINADFKEHARPPDNPSTLYEGYAGAICFLIDMLEPNKATFPFMDVFDVKC
ncbi:CLUMA_CG016555, isoform A [Clunio marinus]|uniref:LanC-like protein 3 homolog n=1 Tax=Clunio marinus TaxID=568069 RepID=A0A1J1IW05_9DIPT|nr:CLUMA_CG016555, isoform A [Clunio marinus]